VLLFLSLTKIYCLVYLDGTCTLTSTTPSDWNYTFPWGIVAGGNVRSLLQPSPRPGDVITIPGAMSSVDVIIRPSILQYSVPDSNSVAMPADTMTCPWEIVAGGNFRSLLQPSGRPGDVGHGRTTPRSSRNTLFFCSAEIRRG
jgi:hypothetical protein